MRSFLTHILSFAFGILIAWFIAYNTFYSSLLFSQLHSSNLFYSYAQDGTNIELKESLEKVYVPVGVCNAQDFFNNPFSIVSESFKDEVKEGLGIINRTIINTNSFCKNFNREFNSEVHHSLN